MKNAEYMKLYRLKKKSKKPRIQPLETALSTSNETSKMTPEGGEQLENTTDYDEVVDVPGLEESHMVFRHPFTCIISGPSKSGKTSLTKRILMNRDKMI